MALEYDLFLDAKLGAVFIDTEIERLSTSERAFEAPFPLTASLFEITTYMRENIFENFRFVPITACTITMDKFAEPKFAYTALIRFSLAVIQDEKISNAALLFGGEIPIFHYDKKVMCLNESRGYWDKNKTDLLSIPYQFRKIPVL